MALYKHKINKIIKSFYNVIIKRSKFSYTKAVIDTIKKQAKKEFKNYLQSQFKNCNYLKTINHLKQVKVKQKYT